MRNVLTALLLLVLTLSSVACSENYSNGERIGMVTRFSKKGIVWKSWEGNLNLTQTGMNSSGEPFDFSVDNDNENPNTLAMIDSAANQGWKVKIIYHETYGKNWFQNRGETNHFVSKVEILDRTPMKFLGGNQAGIATSAQSANGKTVDTIFVVIIGKTSEGYKR